MNYEENDKVDLIHMYYDDDDDDNAHCTEKEVKMKRKKTMLFRSFGHKLHSMTWKTEI